MVTRARSGLGIHEQNLRKGQPTRLKSSRRSTPACPAKVVSKAKSRRARAGSATRGNATHLVRTTPLPRPPSHAGGGITGVQDFLDALVALDQMGLGQVIQASLGQPVLYPLLEVLQVVPR